MKRTLSLLLMFLFSILVVASCTDETNKSNKEEPVSEDFDEVNNMTNTEMMNNVWDIDELKELLKVDIDSDIIFEEYYDFNYDGIDELIIAFGYDNDDKKDYIEDIFYIGYYDEGYKVHSHLEHSGYGYFSVELIQLIDREQPVLYCRNTNYANLEGFELYEVKDNSLNQLVYSASATGVGHDEMLDLDNDGIYTSYLQKRQSYDTLYTVLHRHYSYVEGSFIIDDISADSYNYPSTPEDVVRHFLNMHAIKDNENIEIPDIKARLSDLCPRNLVPPALYNYEEMVEYNIMLESPFTLRTETYDNITYVYQEHQTDDSFPTVVYSLGQYDGKWEIYDYRIIGGNKTQLSDTIDNYFSAYDCDNSELLSKYKKVLMNEHSITFEYVVALGEQEYTIENISYDGFWMKPIRFSLVDMNQDLIPELIVEGELGNFGFVLVIREVDGKMIAHEFSHRQMYDLKSDGSFGASGGAAYSGYYFLELMIQHMPLTV